MQHGGENIKWIDTRELGVEGKGWQGTKGFFERLPEKAENIVREVIWGLSRCPAGISIHFLSDTTEIQSKWNLEDTELSWPTMCSAGKSGFDLYARDDTGKWRWAGVTGEIKDHKQEDTVLTGAAPVLREYMFYLPLFNPVLEFEIGVLENSTIEPVLPRSNKPILVYGSSIVHGRAASRPGMAYPSILGRRLDWPVINLGFSGNAFMEPEISDLLIELDPAIYILDSIPNMKAELIAERAEDFILKIRKAKPKTPIVLMEDRSYATSWICSNQRKENDSRRRVFHEIFTRLVNLGLANLHYVNGKKLLGEDNDATVDSSHPSDLGFYRLADYLEAIISGILEEA